MAKVSLSKLTPIKSAEKKVIQINGIDIEVLQYLGAEEKAAYCERVIAAAIDTESHYISRSRLHVYGELELIRAYTNLNITDKMMEEAPKTYDLLVLNNIVDSIHKAIPEAEYYDLTQKLVEDSDHFETYLHSFEQMLKTISQDYSSTEMNVDKLMTEIKDPQAFDTLKNILEKIG